MVRDCSEGKTIKQSFFKKSLMWLRSLYYTKKSFETLRYDKKELYSFQEKQIQEIVAHAQKIPFYRDRADFSSVTKNLDKLPILSSDELRSKDCAEDLLKRGGSVSRDTSGTTGQPIEITFDEQAHDWLSAMYARTLLIQGYRPKKLITQYWEGMDNQRSFLGRKIMPKRYIDPKSDLNAQIDIISRNNSEILQYFPHTLLAICKKINTEDLDIKTPEIVFTYGELVNKDIKEYIGSVLDSEVRDQYSTTEFGNVAWECPEGGYHILEDAVYPEIIKSNGKKASRGESGLLILTGLVNKDTPLLRYSTGDIVISGPSCGCNTSFRKISSIRGREKDIIFNSNDREIYPDQLLNAFEITEELLSYQVVAENSSYKLRYLPSKNFSDNILGKIAKKLRKDLGLKPLELEKMESFPKNKGGKIRFIDNRQDKATSFEKLYQ